MNFDSIIEGFFWSVYNELSKNSQKVYITIRSSDDFIARNPFIVPYLTVRESGSFVAIDIGKNAIADLIIVDGFMKINATFSKIIQVLEVDLFEITAIGDPATNNYFDFNCLVVVDHDSIAGVAGIPKHERKVAEKKMTRPHLTVVK